jgi:hypothetical protein
LLRFCREKAQGTGAENLQLKAINWRRGAPPRLSFGRPITTGSAKRVRLRILISGVFALGPWMGCCRWKGRRRWSDRCGGQTVEDVVAEGFREAGAGAGLWNINIRNLTPVSPNEYCPNGAISVKVGQLMGTATRSFRRGRKLFGGPCGIRTRNQRIMSCNAGCPQHPFNVYNLQPNVLNLAFRTQ